MPDERPGVVTVTRRVAARVKSRGPKEVLGLATERVRELVLSHDKLIIHERDAGGDAISSPDDLLFKRADASDGPTYARDIGTDSARSFRSRLTGGTECFLVIKHGLVVHATWATSSSAWMRELQRYFCPPPGDVYVYESFTRPEVRGRGVYPLALRFIAKWAGERDVKRLWVGVEHDNPPSLKAVQKAGFAPAFEVSFDRRLGRLTVHPPVGSRAGDCAACLSETPCSGKKLPPKG